MNNVWNTITMLRKIPNHLIIGPGSARLWSLGVEFDNFADDIVSKFRENGINIINPIGVFSSMEKRGKIHFNHCSDNVTKFLDLMSKGFRIVNTISQARARVKDIL